MLNDAIWNRAAPVAFAAVRATSGAPTTSAPGFDGPDGEGCTAVRAAAPSAVVTATATSPRAARRRSSMTLPFLPAPEDRSGAGEDDVICVTVDATSDTLMRQ